MKASLLLACKYGCDCHILLILNFRSKLGISSASIQIEKSVIPKVLSDTLGVPARITIYCSVYVIARLIFMGNVVHIFLILKKYWSNYIVGSHFDLLGCRIAIVVFVVDVYMLTFCY